MVDKEHLEIVKNGSEAIKEWRLRHKNEQLELSYADLSKARLSNANLQNAYLFEADLSDANLTGANLKKADLSFAYLGGSDFTDANLSGSSLGYAQITYSLLSNSNLTNADLSGAIFVGPEMKGRCANLERALMFDTNLIFCNMNDFENLDTVKHQGPSHVDVDTLILSYIRTTHFETLEPFFLNAGVPRSLLRSLPDIVAGMAYCKCFVCYGEPDKAFAERLVNDLRVEGVSCWIYSMDATPGKKIWKEIGQKRRESDMMIVMCSVKSLMRDGVKKEIEEQLDEEPEKMIPISLDNDWKEEGFPVMRGKRDLKQDLINCTYADFSDPAIYNASFSKLLKGLKKAKKSPT